MEQVVAYLADPAASRISMREEFYTLAADPSDELKQKFPWLERHPGRPGASRASSARASSTSPTDADAQDDPGDAAPGLAGQSARTRVMQQAQAQGKDFYQTVILASIVEREAIHDSDKPLVAGVYQNRIDGLGGVRTLNSDPVLIYAKDTMDLRDLHITQWPDYVFWTYDGIGSAADFEVDAGSRGLPGVALARPARLADRIARRGLAAGRPEPRHAGRLPLLPGQERRIG